MISFQVLIKKNKTLEGYIKILDPHSPQTYSEIIQAHSKPSVILVYSESWHIQNQRHIQNPVIFITLAHSKPKTISEPWDIQNQRHTQNLVKHLQWSAFRNS